MNCRIVGVLLMQDEQGGDEKILAVPSSKLTTRYDKIQTYTICRRSRSNRSSTSSAITRISNPANG